MAIVPDCIQQRYCLKNLSRFGTGGSAAYFARVCSREALQDCAAFIRDRGLSSYVLGMGSNCLISDDDFNGLVIRLEGSFCSITRDVTHNLITAGAGTALMKLGVLLALHGYRGMAYMGVIPGTVGGAVRHNAGTRQGCIQDHFAHGVACDPSDGSLVELAPHDMAFSYRHSSLIHTKAVILEATFTLPRSQDPGGTAALDEIRSLRRQRNSTNPASRLSFGSTFKNPAGAQHTAGWYLEQSGMKGMRIGGAQVADEHANWIVNTGSARSEDVKALIATAQKRVAERFGIALEREVVLLPEDITGWT